MESIQIAQILADLSDLQNTDPIAATTLLTSHRLPLNTQTTSTNTPARSNSQGAKFDRLGRRIITPGSMGNGSPARTRASSNLSGISNHTEPLRSPSGAGHVGNVQSSGTGTPSSENSSGTQADEDLQRAKTLLELFEQRGRFKQMGDTGLLRSKERVDAVAAKYAQRDLQEKEGALRQKHTNMRS